jgi:hypothetical protein
VVLGVHDAEIVDDAVRTATDLFIEADDWVKAAPAPQHLKKYHALLGQMHEAIKDLATSLQPLREDLERVRSSGKQPAPRR